MTALDALRAENAAVYGLLADIRAAVGDPKGKLMQDELIAHCRSLRITDEEREAIAEAVGAYNDNDDDEECARIAATLHGLLKRTERRS